MQRLMTLFAMLMLVVMTGCQGGTRVIKDGFTARPITIDSFHAQRW